jgi:TonB family protein
VLTIPKLTEWTQPAYPREQAATGGEGWVDVGLMVDTAGKPFEVTVNASSGDSTFEKAALAAVERARYKPGLLNGQPVESATAIRIFFRDPDAPVGAKADFVGPYERLQRAVKAKDRAQADAAMKLLHVNNLYEDAYYGVASYLYASEWGDETQQLRGLYRAINGAKYLSKEAAQSALLTAMSLNVNLRRYGEAMMYWHEVQGSTVDPKAIEKLRPLMQQVADIGSGHKPYELTASMPDGSWHIRLYEQNFRISISQGHISQVNLRCDKGFIRFTFDPDLEYKVADKYGSCGMEIVGEPGTDFTLTQF